MRQNAQAFIRIYNKHGKKIGKGTVELIADTVIANDNKQKQRFLVTGIGFIKTKRTVGAIVVAGCVADGLITVVVVSSPPVAYLDDEEWRYCWLGHFE